MNFEKKIERKLKFILKKSYDFHRKLAKLESLPKKNISETEKNILYDAYIGEQLLNSYKVAQKLKLQKYLERETYDKLMFCIYQKPCFSIINLIFPSDSVDVSLNPSALYDFTEGVNSLYSKLQFMKDTIPQPFIFSKDALMAFNSNEIEDTENIDEVYPEIRQEIEHVMGAENFSYDGFSIQENTFSLLYFIRKDAYAEVMKTIEVWLKYKEIQNLSFLRYYSADSESESDAYIGNIAIEQKLLAECSESVK